MREGRSQVSGSQGSVAFENPQLSFQEPPVYFLWKRTGVLECEEGKRLSLEGLASGPSLGGHKCRGVQGGS